jgi:hypothetical protein
MAMGKINIGRVILGGLLAGVVINAGESVLNLFVVAGPMEEVLKARNLPPIAGSSIATWVILAFLLGIVTIWLYAAIRPRFGAGPGAAVMAGLAVFFLAYVYTTVGMTGMGFFPANVMFITLGWGLVEILVASVAGAWVYRE